MIVEMKASETFCVSRFAEYYILDLKHCISKVGTTILVCGLVPLMLFVMVFATNLAVGDPLVWKIGNDVKDMVTAVTSILFFLLIPINCYGFLTDKGPGSILLLDEFTSALDRETENLMMSRLTSSLPDKTMIFITHREGILPWCTCRLDLGNIK